MLTLLALLVGSPTAAAALEGDDAPARPAFVRTIEGDVPLAEVLELSAKDGLRFHAEGGATRSMPLTEVARIQTRHAPAPAEPQDGALWLAGGDVLYGRLHGGGDDSVTLRTDDLGDIAIAFDEIVAWYPTAATADAASRHAENQADDIVHLKNGDRVRGFISALDERSVTLESSGQDVVVKMELISAVRFVPPAPRPQGARRLVVTLVNSGRLTLGELAWSQGLVRGRTAGGQAVQIEARRIAAIDVFGGRWLRLTQLAPVSHKHDSMMGKTWGYQVDHNVTGGPLSVGRTGFDYGFGVHSRSVLTFDVPPTAATLVTWFGLDDDSGELADVDVTILVDAEVKFERKGVTRGSLEGPVRVDAAGAKRVELKVDFGRNGDIQDRFDWIDPAFILTEGR